METSDFLVIGGGIIGLSVARELKSRYQDSKIIVLDKEKSLGLHASGRNSGVLHAGFYYTADTLKARFTRDGNKLLTEYCENKKIKLNKCGKLVVAKNQAEDLMLEELMERGKKNGVQLELVDKKSALSIEPKVKTFSRAIYSPTTSTADPTELICSIESDAKKEGIELHKNQEYKFGTNKCIRTTNLTYSAGYIVNCAGLYADRVAKKFGFSQNYAILPFKGLYLKSDQPAGTYQTNIYPVPDLENPFLGVHFTIQVDGLAKIGPTAIPALWREQYKGMAGFNYKELLEIAMRSLGLMAYSNFDFKRLAVSELTKFSRTKMVKLASELVNDITPDAYKKWAKSGIRAQLIDLKKRKLEMDFVVEGDDKSMHVLNAVSPGWTCSIPFSRYVADQILWREN